MPVVYYRKTLLNSQHFNFMSRAIPYVTGTCILAIFAHDMKMYLYTHSFILANRIWPCCVNSTVATYFGFCLLNLSRFDLAARLIESLLCFSVFQSDLRSGARHVTLRSVLTSLSCNDFLELIECLVA